MSDVHEAFRAVRFKDPWDPNFADIGLGCVPSSTIDGIAITNPPVQHEGQEPLYSYVSRFELSDNGVCRYFHAALGDHASDQFILRDNPVAQMAAHFCMMAGTILERGGYFGAVEVLIAVLNAGGAISGEWLNGRYFPRASGKPVVPTDDYRHHVRVPASKLKDDPIEVAASLVSRLLRTIRPAGFPEPLGLP